MSILIKGVKVPKSCAECDFIEYDDEYEFECWCPILRINVEEYTAEKYAGCPLVEIPPHGRLIDKDALMENIEETYCTPCPHNGDYDYCKACRIDDALAVIEAERVRANECSD